MAAAAKAAGRHADNDMTRFLRDYELDYAEALRIRAEAARLTHALLEN